MRIRKENDKYVNYDVEEEVSILEIDKAIRKLKKNKAPELDKFQNEIIQYLYKKYKRVAIYNLLNNCLRNSRFPTDWKSASITFILKDKNKDRTKLNSYRPISLLPTIGKAYERIIVDRIQQKYKDRNLESERQFGFRKNKSTEDAFMYLRNEITNSDRKYIVGLFIDIEGAFDNLWWQAILTRIRKTECSSTLYDTMKSYFKNRRTIVKTKFDIIERMMERRCPQGSILGPAAWNWCMDELLITFEQSFDEKDLETMAYADDLVLLIKANSRRGLEDLGRVALQKLKVRSK